MHTEWSPDDAAKVDDEEFEESEMVEGLGMYKGQVKIVSSNDPAEEIMLLWGIQQPIFSKPNAFVHQSSLQLHLDACGRSLSILQSPSSLVGSQSLCFFVELNGFLGFFLFLRSFCLYFYVFCMAS